MKLAYLLSFSLLAVAGLGCSSNPVGRICFIGSDAGPTENIVASPALECQSRTCLHMQGTTPDLCTAECSGDGDCDADKNTPCDNGFACQVAVVTGPFCCRKVCICKDYIIVPDGGLMTPAACDPSNPINECENLH